MARAALPVRLTWPEWLGVWLLSLAIYAGYFQGQWVYGERPIYHITGDEPHYLLIATSLVRDHDLDVLNNYRERDYFTFYPYHLGDARDPEDMHAIYGRGGRLYSKHSIGLSLLVLPAIASGGRDGHGLAIVLMMGVCAALSALTLAFYLEVTGKALPAVIAWLAVSFSTPILLYADQFYPEIPGAMLTLAGVWGLHGAQAAGRPGTPGWHGRDTEGPEGALGADGTEGRRRAGWRAQTGAFVAGVAVGALPWFHLRYLPLALVLGIAGMVNIWWPTVWPALESLWVSRTGGLKVGPNASVMRRAPHDRLARDSGGPGVTVRHAAAHTVQLALPALLGIGALAALDWYLFGGIPPVDEYGAVTLANVFTGLPGMVVDQQYGLLSYAPVYLCALIGLPLLPHWAGRSTGWLALALIGAYCSLIATFSFWYGAFSPPARMLVPVVPLLGAGLAAALTNWRTWRVWSFTALLILVGWSINHLLMDVPRLRFNLWDGKSLMLAYLSPIWHINLVPLFPSFVTPTWFSYAWTAGAVVATVVIWRLLTLPLPARASRVRASAKQTDAGHSRTPGAAPPG